MVIIRRTLRGTDRDVTLELNEAEATHLQYLEGKRPYSNMAMDFNVLRAMADLADHFERRSDES